MYFDFAVCPRTWESTVVAARVLKLRILNNQDSLSAISKYFKPSCFYDLLVPFVPDHFGPRLGDFAHQLDSVSFTNFQIGKILCEDRFFLYRKRTQIHSVKLEVGFPD